MGTEENNKTVVIPDRRRDSSGYIISMLSEIRVEVSRAVTQILSLRDEYLQHKNLEETLLRKVCKDLDVGPSGHLNAHDELISINNKLSKRVTYALCLSAVSLILVIVVLLDHHI